MTINNNPSNLCATETRHKYPAPAATHESFSSLFPFQKLGLECPGHPLAALGAEMAPLALAATQGVLLVPAPGKEPPRLGLWWPRVVGGWPGLG